MPSRYVALTAALLAALAASAAGADVKKDTSLGAVPGDVAFYSSTLRMKEQLDIFYKSKAYKALRAIPTVKKAYDDAMAKMKEKGGPLEAYEKFVKTKENKELIEVLIEAVSDEIFLVGGKDWVPFYEAFQKVNMERSIGTFEEMLSGTGPDRAPTRATLVALLRHKAKLKIPSTVVGFRIKSSKKGLAQLDRLKKLLDGLGLFVPALANLKSVESKDGKLLTLELDGSMIDFSKIDLSDYEQNKGEFDPLIDHVKKMKLTIVLGVKGDHILFALGETSAEAKRLGSLIPGPKLADLEELKPVLKAGSLKFVSLGYTSKELLTAMSGSSVDYAEIAKRIKAAVKKSDLKDERKKAINDDIDELLKDIKGLYPKLGASVSYSHLTDYGYESMAHDYTDRSYFKSVDFKMHRHFGDSPIFAAGFGFPVDGSSLKYALKYGKKYYDHVSGFVLDMASAEDKAQFNKVTKAIFPVLKKMEDTAFKKFFPSMKNGGLGIVLDGKWKSKEWVKGTKLPREMPMAELGLMLGISDDKLFTEAMSEFRKEANELYAAIREVVPDKEKMPPVSIPAPKSNFTGGATLYWWELPDTKLDKQFMPSVGVGKSVAVLSLSKEHSARLLKRTALKPRDPALAIKGDKIIGVCVFDFVGFVGLAEPWVEFGISSAALAKADDADAKKTAKAEAAKVIKEVKQALAVLRAIKGSTCTTTLVDGKVVQRTVLVIRDIEGVVEP